MTDITPVLFLIGADKGGVGKSTVTRAFLSYCEDRAVPYKAIDTEIDDTSLRRFHKEALAIDVGKVAGQMSVFDNLAANRLTVVDIRAGLLTPTLKAMHEAGFFEDISRQRVKLAVLHVVDANIASLEELANASAQLAEGGDYFVVKNHSTEERFASADWDSYEKYFNHLGAKGTIEIPHLDDMAAKAVDREGIPFSTFAANRPPVGKSEWLRKLVYTWNNKVRAEFDRAGLGVLTAIANA